MPLWDRCCVLYVDSVVGCMDHKHKASQTFYQLLLSALLCILAGICINKYVKKNERLKYYLQNKAKKFLTGKKRRGKKKNSGKGQKQCVNLQQNCL